MGYQAKWRESWEDAGCRPCGLGRVLSGVPSRRSHRATVSTPLLLTFEPLLRIAGEEQALCHMPCALHDMPGKVPPGTLLILPK